MGCLWPLGYLETDLGYRVAASYSWHESQRRRPLCKPQGCCNITCLLSTMCPLLRHSSCHSTFLPLCRSPAAWLLDSNGRPRVGLMMQQREAAFGVIRLCQLSCCNWKGAAEWIGQRARPRALSAWAHLVWQLLQLISFFTSLHSRRYHEIQCEV